MNEHVVTIRKTAGIIEDGELFSANSARDLRAAAIAKAENKEANDDE